MVMLLEGGVDTTLAQAATGVNRGMADGSWLMADG
jgi:hypothetical protein